MFKHCSKINPLKKYTEFIRFFYCPDSRSFSNYHIYSFLLLLHQKICEIVLILAVSALTALLLPLL
ncbi:hypothetical protein ABD67_07250 [Bacillus sonorensis]|uniref:Uncharacterized protein n=1 Tax=Bacillus sonorensis L12 TaxID=1274524 RepID=M5PDE7_9BACI|nr:hypothetical protein BSONL12_18424 [Bacillus sonorensis L12]MBG9914674.1 hypothetical protein [Bacillus sonorensis]TWK83483.1 hypothetical protein CHCC20335_4554 [Bacillus paralicheniformis]